KREAAVETFVHAAGYDSLADDAFVSRLGQDVLGRTLGAQEVAAWTNYLHGGGTRNFVIDAFADSGEAIARDRGRWVRRLGQDTLGRALSDAEAAAWVNYLAAGGTQPAVVAYFTTSAEYYRRVGV